ncbi:MAG: hypothetical protein ACTHM1_02715, partial [Solirubrobacteraceae bacterium]
MSERRRDPRSRPSDPAGTRPKFDPETLRPQGDFRALPSGEPQEERLPEPAQTASPPAVTAPSPHSPHAPRVQFLLGVLGALGVAAIVVAVSLALAPKAKPGAPWSSWKPSGDTDPAVQIAEHVEPQYMLNSRHPLVRVTGGPPQVAGQPTIVALRNAGSEAVSLGANGVLYQLCGSEPNCSIPGKASAQRGLLV